MAGEPAGHLPRALGPVGVTFLTFSALSPAVSVFIYGAGVVHLGGTGAVPALILGGAVIAIIGLLYGEIASAFPDAGGIFPAFSRIIGPSITFPYIAMMMTTAPALLAFGLLGTADYVRSLAPGLPQIAIAIAGLAAASGIAILNIRTGALATGLFLGIELIALTIVSAIAVLHPARDLVSVIQHPVIATAEGLRPLPVSSLGLAVVAGAYTCSGASWAPFFAQELVGAEMRIGRIVAWISPLAAFSIATPIILVLLSAPDLVAFLKSDAPVAMFLEQKTSERFAHTIDIAVILALFNAVVASLMGLGRFVYATGRDGIWPRLIGDVLAQLHRKSQSPANATLALGAATVAMLGLGERILLLLISNQLIFELLLLALAVLVGRARGLTGLHYRTPLHPFVPIFAIMVVAAFSFASFLDAGTGRPSLLLLVAITILSFGYGQYRLRNLG